MENARENGNSAMMAACRFCGQTFVVDAADEAQAAILATRQCVCDRAREERRIGDVIEDAQEKLAALFGRAAENDGFEAVEEPETPHLLRDAVELVARRYIREITVQIYGAGAAKIRATGIGGVKIERVRSIRRSEETV